MVISVPGEFYVYETDVDPGREELASFLQDLGEDDILEIRLNGSSPQKYHVSKVLMGLVDSFFDMGVRKSADAFKEVAQQYNYNIPVPVLDEEGNCVSILKRVWSYYDHYYRYEGGLDMEFLDRYDVLLLMGLNEYSVEIYRKVLPQWRGRRVLLVGQDWRDYMEVLPAPDNVRIGVYDSIQEAEGALNLMNCERPLLVTETLPKNESVDRYKQGIMCYDEIMTLTFMFANVIHPGKKNLGRKYLLIDGFFRIEGIFGIWNKVFTAARYAKAKGYIPAFKIISSNANIYSDYAGDDIWNKFFKQPEYNTIQKVLESAHVVISPNMNILNVMRYVFDEVSKDTQLVWPSGIFNKAVMDYIEGRRRKFLPCPERTLGILLRGTDYKNPLPGHARHATVEMIAEKIEEVKDAWGCDLLYLATEDEEICERMKERYGDKISFTDQERYTVQPGQLLVDLHTEKKKGEGFRMGVEYLCSINLLAHCSSLIASGACGALSEALRENEGRYEHVFTFNIKA